MDKPALVAAVIAQLEDELARQTGAAHSAREEATDEDSRSEGKFDMRGQTAAYLAAGQAQMATEIATAVSAWRSLGLRPFGPDEAAALGAVITLESAGRRSFYLLGPFSGGLEVSGGGDPVVVVTAASPLGRQLLGQRVGARVTLPGRPAPIAHTLVAIG